MLSVNQSENLSQSLWRRTIIVVDQSRHKLRVGSELNVSLQTKDPREAKNWAKDVQDPFDMFWVMFSSNVVELTLNQVVGVAGDVCHRLVSLKDTLRYSSVFWDALRVRVAQIKAPPMYRNPLAIEEQWVDPLADSFSIYVDKVVDKHGLNVGRKTRRFLLEQEVKVYEEMVELMDRRA